MWVITEDFYSRYFSSAGVVRSCGDPSQIVSVVCAALCSRFFVIQCSRFSERLQQTFGCSQSLDFWQAWESVVSGRWVVRISRKSYQRLAARWRQGLSRQEFASV